MVKSELYYILYLTSLLRINIWIDNKWLCRLEHCQLAYYSSFILRRYSEPSSIDSNCLKFDFGKAMKSFPEEPQPTPGLLWYIKAHLAMTKSSLTILDPSPMNFCTSSEPLTLMNVHSVWWATARASRVLPVPGGPYNNTPCRITWEIQCISKHPAVYKERKLCRVR